MQYRRTREHINTYPKLKLDENQVISMNNDESHGIIDANNIVNSDEFINDNNHDGSRKATQCSLRDRKTALKPIKFRE